VITTKTFAITTSKGEFHGITMDIGATIEELRTEIELATGVKSDKQKLYSRDILVEGAGVIPVDLGPSLTMDTTTTYEVASPEGEHLCSVTMELGATAAGLKAEIETKTGIKHVAMRLFSKDRLLYGDHVIPDDLENTKLTLRTLPKEYLRTMREVVMSAVSANGLALKYAADVMQADCLVALAAVRQNGLALKYAAEMAKVDRTVCLAAVRQNGWAYQDVPDSLKTDKEIVLIAVATAGRLLEVAPATCKADKDVVRAAVANDKVAMNYAARSLQSDQQFRRDALGQVA